MRGILSFSLGVVLATGVAAHADYQGLSVERHTTVNIAGITRDVYRVYANFDDPGNHLTALSGSPNLGVMTIESRNSIDSGPGSNFFNSPLVGNRPPTQEVIDLDADAAWDSFYTIGISVADQAPYGDQMQFTPGFPSLVGNLVTTGNGGWSAFPSLDHDGDPGTPLIPSPQTLAGFLGDGDPFLRVMMLQLTVNAGDHVRGTMTVSVRLHVSQTGFSIPNQTFSNFPSPGALTVFALAALRWSRRRSN